MLTIWRLDEAFGIRQMLWLGVSIFAFILALIIIKNLTFLRRYKYVFLSGGLLITGLTLLFGTNPLGYGPRLWLGCCGVYFQPSEPLKLLLVIYLSAYLADRVNIHIFSLPLLVPMLVVTGLALLLLLVQRACEPPPFLFPSLRSSFFNNRQTTVLLNAALFLLVCVSFGIFLY